ncbi:MAG TPA: CHAT domain-containing tetratricopeptide repeat protein [Thermoanaerobaculia bacterium]|nr:CHAT domain-containing tetratricopeptide repeat protein [Thermoanaerobaculia bacterium]
MDRLPSKGLVRRALSLSAVLAALILSEGSGPAKGPQPAPPPATPSRVGKKVPSPPASHPPPKEFLKFEGRSEARSLGKDEVHAYLFDLEPGDFVDIEVEQQGLDVEAKVFASGEPTFKVDHLNKDSGPENVPLLAEAAGRYRVELKGSGGGNYQIRVLPKRKATSRDRQDVTGALAYSRGQELKHGNKAEAEQEFRKALESWESSGYRVGQADASYQLEKLLAEREARSEALPFLDKASTLYHGLGNLEQEAIILHDLGIAHADLTGLGQALPFFERALTLVRTIKSTELEADFLYDRGMLYSRASEFTKSLEDLRAALVLQQKLSSRVQEAKVLNALGNTYSALEDIDMALTFYKRALEFLKNDPDGYIKGLTYTNLGDAYKKRGEIKRAISDYLRSLKLLQASGHHRDEETALNNLGTAYFEAARYLEALNAFQHCQRIFEAQGKIREAAVAWTNVGWVLAVMKRYHDAVEAYDKSLGLVRNRDYPLVEVEAYHGLAWTEWKQGHLNSARSFLQKSLSSMESLRTKSDRAELRSSFLAGRQDLYDLMVEILMDQHRHDLVKGYDFEAFAASERARSRTLMDDLEGRPVLPELSVQDIQRQVLDAEDVVLLEYFFGDKRSYLWVVTSSSFTGYELPVSRAQIEALAREVHGLQAASSKRELQSIAIRKSTDLSRILFGQVATRLAGKKLLIVVPSALQSISFGALPEDLRESRRQGTAWPRSWGMDHEITVELSATVLATLRRLHKDRPRPSKSIAILGDPVFSPADERLAGKGDSARPGEKPPFPRLRYSEGEALAIEAQARQDKPLLALGFDANRQMVLAGSLKDFGRLHFSTHGVVDTERPDRSAIVLSLVDREGKPVDGYLRAGEIAKLKLPADLVVLSACRTGLGREIRGEGLVGLTQEFFTAGASRVAVSLWDVDDQATAQLMGRFYQNLFQSHMSPAAALREAQVWMGSQPRWNAPSYWAGFVLQGEWK